MRWRKAVGVVGAKVALTLAFALPRDTQGLVDYWVVGAVPGLEVGAPVLMGGRLVGQVTAKSHWRDTTFLKVRFNNDATRLPRSRIARLQRFGMDGMVFLDMRVDEGRQVEAFTERGRLRVMPEAPSADPRDVPNVHREWGPQPPFVWLPPAPPKLLELPPRSA